MSDRNHMYAPSVGVVDLAFSTKLNQITCTAALAAILSLGGSVVALDRAQAEATISVFGGANFSPHSEVDYDFNNGTSGDTTVQWDGASFEMPPYYGVRATWWLDQAPNFGIAAEFTHAKVKADPLPADFSVLEFTDGINFVTLNGIYRRDIGNGFTPYIGVGAGISVPHVEADDGPGGAPATLEYQVTGFAAQAFVGVDYSLTDNWSVFGELKSTYGQVEADLEGGGELSTDIISNQIILGITYKVF